MIVQQLRARYTRVLLQPQLTWADVLSPEIDNPEWSDFDFTPLWVDEPYLRRGKSADGLCTIVYVQDPLREIRYYHLFGADVERHAAIIRERVATYSRQDITAAVTKAQNTAGAVVAIYLAAASTSADLDSTLLDFFTLCLASPEARVRLAAIDATLLVFWPALRAPLERVADQDPEADLRTFARETLNTLSTRVWDRDPGTFDFTPIPPDRRRIIPLSGVGDRWYEAAHGENFPKRRAPGATTPLPSRKPEFNIPTWLAKLMKSGDWGEIRWQTLEQIGTSAGQYVEWKKPDLMPLSATETVREQLLWEDVVLVGNGPKFIDRGGRIDQSQLFINRTAPKGLLLAFGRDHLPTLWVSAGRTRASIDAVVGAYLFSGLPKQPELPFQGRLFLATRAELDGGFADVERMLERSPFTDMLPWGNSHATDPYPERVTLGQVPVSELRRFTTQNPHDLPRTSIRTRYSRSVIQLIDWRNGYFADLYFQSTLPYDWVAKHNTEYGTDFPPGTPVDIVGALHGLACIGPDRIRPQMEEAEDDYQRQGMKEIIGFLEQRQADQK